MVINSYVLVFVCRWLCKRGCYFAMKKCKGGAIIFGGRWLIIRRVGVTFKNPSMHSLRTKRFRERNLSSSYVFFRVFF